jgi:hypothetical protein
MGPMSRSPLFWLLISLLLVAVLTVMGPEEQSLGANVRVVYLHGAWVLTALVSFVAAGLVGSLALITRRQALHRWSQALGWTAMLFWITYLPLSLWAMQANWNGLFLTEPRWRTAWMFAVTGLLLQVGLALLSRPALTSLANLVYIVALGLALENVGSVMHPPPSPIFNSGIWQIQLFFIGLNLCVLFAAWQVARWWFDQSARIALQKPVG